MKKQNSQQSELAKIFTRQLKFNKNFFPKTASDVERQKWTKDLVLHITDECYEVLHEVNWKLHKKATKEVDRAKLLEECIDVFKFWLCLMNVWGFDADVFVKEFHRKSEIVESKFKKEYAK